jgi:hypothetical protein
MIFLIFFMSVLGEYEKLNDECFFLHAFQFIIHWSF